jgi:hypothetical protein
VSQKCSQKMARGSIFYPSCSSIGSALPGCWRSHMPLRCAPEPCGINILPGVGHHRRAMAERRLLPLLVRCRVQQPWRERPPVSRAPRPRALHGGSLTPWLLRLQLSEQRLRAAVSHPVRNARSHRIFDAATASEFRAATSACSSTRRSACL